MVYKEYRADGMCPWHLGSVAMQPELFGIQRLLDYDP